MKIPPFVYVEWLDHVTKDGGAWIEISKLKKARPVLFGTGGFVIREDDTSLTLAGTLEMSKSKDAVGSGDLTIVKSCIVTRKTLDL